jgi:hypothetical protein
MTAIPRFLKAVFPNLWAEDMERESRAWMMRCSVCNAEKSVWDNGGVRWKASGSSKMKVKCDRCGQNTWQSIYKAN